MCAIIPSYILPMESPVKTTLCEIRFLLGELKWALKLSRLGLIRCMQVKGQRMTYVCIAYLQLLVLGSVEIKDMSKYYSLKICQP